MEDNISIQNRISALEQHLEVVRKRAKDLFIKENDSIATYSVNLVDKQDSEKFSEDLPSSSSDSFSSSEVETKNSNQMYCPYPTTYPTTYQNYYPAYYPQQDLRQQVEYLHFQINQNQQYYLNTEKKLLEENIKLKECISKQGKNENQRELEEKYKELKEKFDDYENKRTE